MDSDCLLYVTHLKEDPDFKCVVPREPRHTIKKGWGGYDDSIGEIFIYHTDPPQFELGYGVAETVKALYIKKGKRLSTHFHVRKKELFYMLEGRLLVELTANGRTITVNFRQGDTMIIPPGMVHSMEGVHEKNILIEVSTKDRPDDSYRIKKGD